MLFHDLSLKAGCFLVVSGLVGGLACGGGKGASAAVAATVPAIGAQPRNQTVVEGNVASFSVTATGTGTLAYQWKRNGTALAGATASSYSTAATTLADSGSVFTVVVSNGAGGVMSTGAVLTVEAASTGNTYHLDSVNGADDTADGSQAKPFRTFAKALASVVSGDTVLVHTGTYGTMVAGRTEGQSWEVLPLDLFTDWVTFRAAPGETPSVASLDIGTMNIEVDGAIQRMTLATQGNADFYLRFDGLTFEDGVSIQGGRHVEVRNCTVHRLGDLNTTAAIMDGTDGVDILYGRYITLQGNDINHVAIGINAVGSDLVFRGNEIHHNSHDGIRIYGGTNWLIEGNRIHDLDDGMDDDSGNEANRHVDGIQLFDLVRDGSDTTHNLTIRNNLFYNIEAMGMMLQCNADAVEDALGRSTNWVIENNIFGPVGGRTIILGVDVHEGFVLRHNTVVRAPNDTWTSMYRTLPKPDDSQSYNIQMWDSVEHPEWFSDNIFDSYRVYNNIFGDGSVASENYAFVANNLYYGGTSTLDRGNRWMTGLPYVEIPGTVSDFIAAGGLLGLPVAGGEAVDAGTTVYASEDLYDFLGLARDALPDIGAREWR